MADLTKKERTETLLWDEIMTIGFEATKKGVLCSTKYILNDLQPLEA